MTVDADTATWHTEPPVTTTADHSSDTDVTASHHGDDDAEVQQRDVDSCQVMTSASRLDDSSNTRLYRDDWSDRDQPTALVRIIAYILFYHYRI